MASSSTSFVWFLHPCPLILLRLFPCYSRVHCHQAWSRTLSHLLTDTISYSCPVLLERFQRERWGCWPKIAHLTVIYFVKIQTKQIWVQSVWYFRLIDCLRNQSGARRSHCSCFSLFFWIMVFMLLLFWLERKVQHRPRLFPSEGIILGRSFSFSESGVDENKCGWSCSM